MVELTTGKCTVKRGDCAWKAAKENLKNNGQKITNAEIAKEMQRLAKLNGCDSVEDFNNKFFSKIGNEYITGNKSSSEKVIPEPKKENDTIKHKREEFLQDSITKPDATRVARPVTKMPINNEPILSAKEAEMKRINEIQDDTSKIIEYNKKNAKGNYVIVDKKSCKATVYNKDGKALESYEILLGQDKGDDLSTAYAKDPSKRTYTTVPGEYEITGEKTTFGGTYHLGGVNYIFDPDVEMRSDAPGSGGKKKFGGAYLALHGTANPKVRNKYYDNGNLADNRQSMGCVNIPVDKFLKNSFFLSPNNSTKSKKLFFCNVLFSLSIFSNNSFSTLSFLNIKIHPILGWIFLLKLYYKILLLYYFILQTTLLHCFLL